MSNNAEPTVAVKLFIDKEKKRVMFAESDKEFVDVLFSFLMLPLGTIVRALGKQSELGCLDEMYKSVESLSIDHFQTKACKTMLLRPLNAAAIQCDGLNVKVDDTNNPRACYVCSNSYCLTRSYSSVPDAICKSCYCGLSLRHVTMNAAIGNSVDGVFVRSVSIFPLLDKFGLHGQANVEEKILQLNSYKMAILLKRALLSKEPLTGLYSDAAFTSESDAVNLDQLPENMFPKQSKFIPIKMKLVQTTDDSSVLYAEAGQDFIDTVFGLLNVPLGSIVKAYRQWFPNGCVHNLYESIEGSARERIKEECKSLLLSPKFALWKQH
ncbi:hypothetical protein ACP4OV_026501 [Aristida adscensionis]